MSAVLSQAGATAVNNVLVNTAGWALTLGGILITALWLRSLTR